MATRGNNTGKGFIITEDVDIDVSTINKSIRKVLSAIHSILTLGWIPSNDKIDPDNLENFDVDKAREAQLAKMSNISTSAHLYSRRF